MTAPVCEPMHPDEEGWSEWIHPLPGYLMECCDCGLIHDAEFQIGQRDGDGPLNPGESDEAGVIIFRMRRHAVQPEPERPSPEDYANKSQREAAYWRERCEAMEAKFREISKMVGDVFHGKLGSTIVLDAIDDIAQAVRENITPETDTPKVGE